MHRRIYGIIDQVTDDLIGPLQIHRHDAAAIRYFGDVMSQQNSPLRAHPEHFDLVHLGVLIDRDGQSPMIDSRDEPSTVLTGAAWFAALNDTKDAT